MFQSLGDRLGGIFSKLRRQGRLTEEDITAVMHKVRCGIAHGAGVHGILEGNGGVKNTHSRA